jgi:hypothetical protein
LQEVNIESDSVFPIGYMLRLRYTFPIKLQDIVWRNNGAENEQVEQTMVILNNGKSSAGQITRQVRGRGWQITARWPYVTLCFSSLDTNGGKNLNHHTKPWI